MKFLNHADLQGNRVTAVGDAVATTDAPNLAQVRAMLEGNNWKDSVRVASVANVNLAAPGASIDAIALANGDRVLLRAQTDAKENGIWLFAGAAAAMTRALDANTFDELEAATVRVEEGTANGGTKWVQTAVNGVIGVNNITWIADSSSAPAASETVAGILEVATQAEADAGALDDKILTPAKAAVATWAKRKFAANVGDGSATAYNVDHNFGTRDVHVQVYANGGIYDDVLVDITRPTINRVTLTFAAAPGIDAYRAVIVA